MTLEIQLVKSRFSDCIGPSNSPQVSVIAGELSNRRYFRISVKDSAQKSPTFVLQESESFDNAAEHPFLIAQKIFSSLGIRVPHVHGSSGKEGWILTEDCGDTFLQYRQELHLYREALDMILTLQRHGQKDDARIPVEIKKASHWDWVFDKEKFQSEMKNTEKYFFRSLLRDHFAFVDAMENNSTWLAARPRVLCHRDFHSRNLLIKNDHVYALDFQDARMGPVTYDLVSLLWDPYANLRDDLRVVLWNEWKLNTHPDYLRDVNIEVERMKIQRLLKAVGTYASFYIEKKNPACFVFVEAALADTLEAFENLDELGQLTGPEKKLQTHLQKIYAQVKDS